MLFLYGRNSRIVALGHPTIILAMQNIDGSGNKGKRSVMQDKTAQQYETSNKKQKLPMMLHE